VAMAMTFDPDKDEVVVYCDGVATPTRITDPVAQDVFQYKQPVASNPFHYPWPIFSPRSFILKFNGYKAGTSGVYEHWLHVDTDTGTARYDRSSPSNEGVKTDFWVTIDVRRAGASILTAPVTFQATKTNNVELPVKVKMQPGDEIVTSLDFREGDGWRRVGKEIRYRLRDGAPFTFGRALGLGTEPVEHGTQLYLDGVAVFNRVLSNSELQGLSFADR